MELFNRRLKEELEIPDLYATEGTETENLTIKVKFFDIFSNAKWWIIEANEEADGDWLFFCYVTGLFENELGYVTLSQLTELNEKFPRIERDLNFDKTTLGSVKREHEDKRYHPYPVIE